MHRANPASRRALTLVAACVAGTAFSLTTAGATLAVATTVVAAPWPPPWAPPAAADGHIAAASVLHAAWPPPWSIRA